MDSARTVTILGLGTYGLSLCRALSQTDVEVIAIDRHEAHVDSIKDIVGVAITGDATDPAVLEGAGVANSDVAIVAIGENTESSIIATLNLQDLGIGQIYARAMTHMHRRVLRKLGITQVINPEEDAAVRLAASLSERAIEQLVDLGEGFSFVVVSAPERFAGKNLAELDLRRTFRVNVVGIRRLASGSAEGGIDFSYTRFVLPDGNTVVEEHDRLLVVGRPDDVRGLGDQRHARSGATS
ncbi:MAG TPA: TrkA family potassium uptake protein [Alkalispirochaeta sp.]|nr:TrkA family potassium uptake protein [Alkalispirochaeta sp.]